MSSRFCLYRRTHLPWWFKTNTLHRYLGRQDDGILLGEASHGTLEAYLCAEGSSITVDQRKIWCRQAIEAIAYIHGYGVVHADMRPENFLIHERSPGCLDLLLCDFGGAKCDELGLYGNQLPDGPFYDPTLGTDPSPPLDIFSLGSISYTILTGLWPYRSSGGPFGSVEEMLEYVSRVDTLFRQKKYPSIAGLVGGNVIMGCWTKKYKSADDVLTAWDKDAMFIVDETQI